MTLATPDPKSRRRRTAPAVLLELTLTLLVPALLLLPAAPSLAQDDAPPKEAEAQAAPAPMPQGCQGEEWSQLDFWLGDWEVHEWGKEGTKKPAHNAIHKIQDGCALREEYSSPAGYSGTSLSFYDRFDKRWHQVWIDTGGQPLYLVGGLEDGKMVLSDDPQDARPRSRITWTPQDDGSVRQTWEMSRDHGATWDVVFDGHYIRGES